MIELFARCEIKRSAYRSGRNFSASMCVICDSAHASRFIWRKTRDYFASRRSAIRYEVRENTKRGWYKTRTNTRNSHTRPTAVLCRLKVGRRALVGKATSADSARARARSAYTRSMCIYIQPSLTPKEICAQTYTVRNFVRVHHFQPHTFNIEAVGTCAPSATRMERRGVVVFCC